MTADRAGTADVTGDGLTYAAAGVDTEAGDRAVTLMKDAVRATHAGVAGLAPVVEGAGGFAGLVDASLLLRYRRPLLATSTDGVGTKVAVAQAMDVHDTVGVDLVAMVVDDLVACGATPLFMSDYVACGSVVPERVAAIVRGVARGCETARCALVAGETAEHPGLLAPDEYDLAGAATGVVEADALLGPERVRAGDVLVALASSGLHANGYSLARAVVARQGWAWDHVPQGLGRSIGEELLEPCAVYAGLLVDLLDAVPGAVHALSHVTGGGIAANLARVLPAGTHVDVDRATWRPPVVTSVLGDAGGVPVADRERTWNQGIGMVAVVAPDDAERVLGTLAPTGTHAWVCGEVVATPEGVLDDPATATGTKGVSGGSARLVGVHPV
ncbi:phosphoribosylformylglycinamidine cyclo-ligase [Aquipuribacter nitratireducens]|uniref:Phosphoribosylformylglycinamidine cyclo-ligase n=1 Tax=Aquipuribacter nitratireducens TaxID=650104 RepID=A0ABW0GRT6_9MICO